jgi:hypothetical protein
VFTEKENDKKERTGLCGCCDGTFEMIKGCFPDDAGYAADLARMKKNWGKFCSQKDGGVAKGEKK